MVRPTEFAPNLVYRWDFKLEIGVVRRVERHTVVSVGVERGFFEREVAGFNCFHEL